VRHPDGARGGLRVRGLALNAGTLVGRLARRQQALAAILILLFAACTIAITAATLKRHESTFLEATATQLARSIALERDEEGTLQRAATATLEEDAPVGVRVQILDADGREILSYPDGARPHQGWRTTRRQLTGGGWLVVAAPVATRQRALWALSLALALAAVPLLVLTTAMSQILARDALRPLSRIASQAERVTVDLPPERFGDSSDPQEIASLALAFDRLLLRLHEGLRAERHFSRDAAHELRTPLTVVSGEIEFALQDRSLAPTAREGLRHAREQARSMSDLVEALLLLQRAEPGSNGLEALRQPVNLGDLVRDLEHEIRMADAGRTSDLEVRAEDEVLVPGHATLLAAAIRNLLGNALKFTSPGQRILVRVERETGRAAVVVEDAGRGIAPEDQERVFDPFFRSAEARAAHHGFGLGLPILRRVARAHHGDVVLTKSPLGGARFTLWLPAWGSVP